MGEQAGFKVPTLKATGLRRNEEFRRCSVLISYFLSVKYIFFGYVFRFCFCCYLSLTFFQVWANSRTGCYAPETTWFKGLSTFKYFMAQMFDNVEEQEIMSRFFFFFFFHDSHAKLKPKITRTKENTESRVGG